MNNMVVKLSFLFQAPEKNFFPGLNSVQRGCEEQQWIQKHKGE
jgi:hypothetical protein